MMTTPRYDLTAIFQIIYKNSRTVFRIVLLAIIAAGLAYFIIPRKYEAETVFILKNPLYADRNNLYNNETKFIDYVGNDEDIDRLMSMALSDSVQVKVITKMHLAALYDYDSTNKEEYLKLRKKFKKRLKMRVNEYKNIVLTYVDKDPKIAAAIANCCVNELEHSLRSFYNDMRRSMYQSIMNKIHEEDSAVFVLTDTLIKLREQYGIYDIVSPSRYNLMLSSMKGNGHTDYAKGIEVVQNIESVKDELVSDRAKHITLANQYSTGTEMNEMPLTEIIQVAEPPLKQVLRNLAINLIIGGVLGLLFGVIYVLFSAYYSQVRLKEN